MEHAQIKTADASSYDGTPIIRVAICGECQSGKSALLNAILRENVLPDNLDGRHRPTVFAEYSDDPCIEFIKRDDADAAEGDVVESIQLMHDKADLMNFEFIEVPLTSAENLTKAQIDLIRSADVMVWVTIASQAWRLTEKTILEELDDAKPDNRILTISRADKLRNKTDREKIMSRVERETEGYFEDRIYLHSSKQLIKKAATSETSWRKTGAMDVISRLQQIAKTIAAKRQAEAQTGASDEAPAAETATELQRPDAAAIAQSNLNIVLNSVSPLLEDMRGDVLIGVYLPQEPNHCEVINGKAEACQKTGIMCRQLTNAWLNAYGIDDTGETEIGIDMMTNARSLHYRGGPHKTSLFMMSELDVFSRGEARLKHSQLCKALLDE